MIDITSPLITIPLVFLTIYVSTFLLFFDSYKKYKSTYNALKSGQYVFNYRSKDLTFFKQINDLDQFTQDNIVFAKDQYIKLIGKEGRFIHRQFAVWLDPYTFYYYHKLWNWFKKNEDTFINN